MKRAWLLGLALGMACASKHEPGDDGAGGNAGSAGTSHAGSSATGGAHGNAGGMNASGGSKATAGEASGGFTAAGGAHAAGGSTSAGGSSARGGSTFTAGSSALGGFTASGGAGESGDGASGASGEAGSGGSSHASGGAATGGAAGSAGGSALGGSAGSMGGSGSGDVPVVELLLDGSSSMFDDGMWEAVQASLITDGMLAEFESKLDLGVSIFQGHQAASEDSAACATMLDFAFGTMSADAVGAEFTTLRSEYPAAQKWQTPTDYAVRYATELLDAVAVPVTTRKYILLVTDGPPNTCVTSDPMCGQDLAITAVQAARADGVRTLVVGQDPSIDKNSGCPTDARCGLDYLQDMANAGVGAPVEPPSSTYQYESCVIDHVLNATYATAGDGGAATYYVSTTSGDVTAALRSALQSIVDGNVP